MICGENSWAKFSRVQLPWASWRLPMTRKNVGADQEQERRRARKGSIPEPGPDPEYGRTGRARLAACPVRSSGESGVGHRDVPALAQVAT